MLGLGDAFIHGRAGLPKAPEIGVVWYSRALDLGYISAGLKLAEMYDEGEVVPRDAKRALADYEAAANAGSRKAAYQAGLRHEAGRGTAVDTGQAIE